MKKHIWTQEEDDLIMAADLAKGNNKPALTAVGEKIGLAYITVYQRSRALGLHAQKVPTFNAVPVQRELKPPGLDHREPKERGRVFREIIPLPVAIAGEVAAFRPFPRCCYIVNETPPFRYCDEPTENGKSMCQVHHHLCFRRPSDWEDRLIKDVE